MVILVSPQLHIKNRKFAFKIKTSRKKNMETIVNKVALSGIITLNLEDFLPEENQILDFDLKPFLFKEMILREKDFRTAIAAFDWSIYEGKTVAVFCSVDAIIPMWAYMLIGSLLEPYSTQVYFGNSALVTSNLLLQNIQEIDASIYEDQRVIIKGCGDHPLPEAAYITITQKLKPFVKSLMYGEPCSTVPIYKKKK